MGLNPEVETESQELVEYHDADILNLDVGMEEKLELAGRIATKLKKVLEDQGLVVNLKNNEYVCAEGWNTLGTILGCTPRTDEVVPVDFTKSKIGYKARVSIMQGDNVLSTAEAIATSGGFQKEEHQIYSMAQTRAMGKAYRMALSWIMKLAGYEPTPAEEMVEQIEEEKKQKAKNKNVFTDDQKRKLKSSIEVEAKDVEIVK